MKNLSLKTKFLLIIGSILGVMVLIGVMGYISLKNVSEKYEHIANINMPNLNKLSEMKESVLFIRGNLNRMAYNYKDEEDRKEMIEAIQKRIAQYEKAEKEYNEIKFVPGEEVLANAVAEKWKNLKKFTLHLLDIAKDSSKEAQANYLNEILSFTAITREYAQTIDSLMDFQSKEANKWTLDVSHTASSAITASLTLVVVGVLFGLFFSYILVNRLSKQLSKITEQVGSASTQVSSASEQLSTAADQLSSVSQQQASALEESSASLAEIQGMAESNIKGAEETNNVANQVYQISETTRKSMDELTKAMSSILESNVRIEKLVKVIEEIGEKTEIIDDIVFKTQLLSFNASVEAERAGEHGRGFAVVAQEVGNLAQMSGKAALEISGIVKNSIKEAEAVASENKNRVESGGTLASETKEKMEVVLQKLTGILQGSSKIVDASKEQGLGIGQISSSVESISQMTQETAGTAEESASASAELSAQAKSLMDLVNQLRLVVVGEVTTEGSYEAPAARSSETSQDKKSKVVQLKTKMKTFKAAPLKGVKVANESPTTDSGAQVPDAQAWDKL